jgi:hypothetical protein
MTKPAEFPLEWVRGTTTPLIFAMKRNGVPLPFDDIRISVWINKGKQLGFRVTLSDGDITVLDPATGQCRWIPLASQTRMLTQTKADDIPLNKYEIEYRYGTSEEVYLMGTVSGIGGINDDEDMGS